MSGGQPVPPEHRIYFYSAAEWETFVEEWLVGLGDEFVQVKRLGGPGDGGVDVAGFRSLAGFEGLWDCYQCKHYAKALTPGDTYPEVLKLFQHAVKGDYKLPARYVFVAPKGCGAALNRLLSSPTTYRSSFVEWFKAQSPSLSEPDEAALRLAELTDFSMFVAAQLHEILRVHRMTQHFSVRFGTPLSERPPSTEPPSEVVEIESRYVQQLTEVYSERLQIDMTGLDLGTHPALGEHFRRQRVNFFRAESLRLYARDSVPDGTFEALQDEIYEGVIEESESDHATGFDRLAKVLTAAGAVNLDSHMLVTVTRVSDRKGICHQLASDDRLRWVPKQ